MADYVQYHNSEKMRRSCLEFSEDDDLDILTNKHISDNLTGSRIWLIGGIGDPRQYYLCYNFIVDTIGPADGDFKFVVSGQEGILLQPPISLNTYPWFKDFLKSQQNFSMGLQRIEKKFVSKLEKVISSQGAQSTKSDEQSQKAGGGFGAQETNLQVEQAAIALVGNNYKKRGWSVESVEVQKCGYDLLCTKGKLQEHVEVKGIQGELLSFIITNGEVKQSRSDEKFVLCAVTSALSKPQFHRFTVSEFLEKFTLDAVSYRASLKQTN
jgi:hypothetical protein